MKLTEFFSEELSSQRLPLRDIEEFFCKEGTKIFNTATTKNTTLYVMRTVNPRGERVLSDCHAHFMTSVLQEK